MSADATGAPTREEILRDLQDAAATAGQIGGGQTIYALHRPYDLAEVAAAAKRLQWLSESIVGLLEDRERLEWLERNGSYVTRYNVPFEGWQVHWETNRVDANGEFYGGTAREAIDAARASLPEDSTNG